VAGTHYIEGDFHSYRDSYINVHHVNGQIALPQEVLRNIGGYVPIKAVASTGWRNDRANEGWTTFFFGENVRASPQDETGGRQRTRRDSTMAERLLSADIHCGRCSSTFQLAKKPYVQAGMPACGYMWC
jgi:hypothetical protein